MKKTDKHSLGILNQITDGEERSNKTVLVNFKVYSKLLEEFKKVAEVKNRTVSSLFRELMRLAISDNKMKE